MQASAGLRSIYNEKELVIDRNRLTKSTQAILPRKG